jgi:hypothetical protein
MEIIVGHRQQATTARFFRTGTFGEAETDEFMQFGEIACDGVAAAHGKTK